MTYTLIAHTEVGSGGAANITFTSIPATFTDLVIVFSNRSTAAQGVGGAAGQIQFNTYATDPTSRALRGQGSGSPASFTFPQFVTNASDSTSSTFGNASIYITNYASSAAKSISIDSVSENNATFAEQQINAMLWSVTSAITSIRLITFSGNLAEFTSATLYGITAGSSGGVVVS
jgi:hypothetical protein